MTAAAVSSGAAGKYATSNCSFSAALMDPLPGKSRKDLPPLVPRSTMPPVQRLPSARRWKKRPCTVPPAGAVRVSCTSTS